MIRLRSLIIATLFGVASFADAAPYEHAPVMYQSGGISRDQAVAMMQAKYSARVMRADTAQENGRVVYYIRLTTQDRSRVWTVRVDAATGQEF